MEFITQHPWRDLILKPLTKAQQGQAVDQANSDWEYIDTEMAKLGTISHETVNISDVQARILNLLTTETKDFRLLAHLINTLQRSEQATYILLAITLLADYVESYWQIAAPQKNKKRIAQMMIQRFNNAKGVFCHSANAQEQEQSTHEFVRLKQLWKNEPELCEELDKLIIGYAKTQPIVENKSPTPISNPAVSSAIEPSTQQKTLPHVTLDNSSERAWNKTLLKIAEIEAERSFTTPLSFQLRRHAVWFSITTPPLANNNITQVPPLPLEKTHDFEKDLSRASYELWQKIENTISYSPYWFDGHYLSASIAEKLGHHTTANIIRHELTYFLERFPECESLCFNNSEPFMSEKTRKWLLHKEHHQVQSEDYTQALNLFQNEGLQQALSYLEQITSDEPRALFYSQFQAVNLLNLAGCHKLAKQQLDTLVHKATLLSAKEWETSFFNSCNGLRDILDSKESL